MFTCTIKLSRVPTVHILHFLQRHSSCLLAFQQESPQIQQSVHSSLFHNFSREMVLLHHFSVVIYRWQFCLRFPLVLCIVHTIVITILLLLLLLLLLGCLLRGDIYNSMRIFTFPLPALCNIIYLFVCVPRSLMIPVAHTTWGKIEHKHKTIIISYPRGILLHIVEFENLFG